MYINRNLEHGKRTTYIREQCRCPECRKANSDYLKRYRRIASQKEDAPLYEYQKIARDALDWVIANRPDVYKELTRGL